MASEQKSAALMHLEAQLAEMEQRYGLGGAERQAIIPEDLAATYRALVLRRRALTDG